MQLDPMIAKGRFGLRLRQLRKNKGLSQEALAERAGLDRTYISSCERGRRNVGLVNIYRIAQALEADPALLFADPEEIIDLKEN